MPDSPSPSGEAESSGGLWSNLGPAIRKALRLGEGDRSLRAQLEEAIDEHEDENEDEEQHESSAGGNGDLSPVERQMLRNLLHFSDNDADDVAVPRGEIVAVEAGIGWDELVATFSEHGHSRMPVYRGTLDDVIGMIHIKDVFGYLANGKKPPRDWTVLMRQPLYVPQARGALDVLADMRARRVHLAIVLDEFSGTDGIITIEDLVEEIVGEIEDEHDETPEALIVPIGDGMWDCDARAELDDVAEHVDPRLAEVEESVDTLGGLAFVLGEAVPPVGAVLEHSSGWRIEVTEGDDTHVKRLRLHAPHTRPTEPLPQPAGVQ
ncbi:CBS domain-containing protein [Erythrobacter litoralis]|uniref:Cobalt transporter n=1 Tax=Erythrobacter litoralis TaxID=39960 RepID=A0A074N4Y1_9SPHN|nr:hemolysin family protein [Erythrobacter litoralis]AOL23103.1 CBS domain-containing protein [Erythrobacter litoralis]KEO93032.1 cobalt transporter [Erythrobacter litoralis]MEE4339337.1 hemolysin family protein [Erythrobacter sp.]